MLEKGSEAQVLVPENKKPSEADLQGEQASDPASSAADETAAIEAERARHKAEAQEAEAEIQNARSMLKVAQVNTQLNWMVALIYILYLHRLRRVDVMKRQRAFR